MDIEAVPVLVLDRELPEPPRLVRDRIHDICSGRTQLGVGGVNVWGKDPMNHRLERRLPSAKEDRDVSPRYGTNILARIEPADVESEHVTIVRLRMFDVGNGQFRHGLRDRGQRWFHDPLSLHRWTKIL